jgi:hypothetical protein
MVRAGYHWSDRTTAGHLQSYVNSGCEYEPECKKYDINCFEGIMQFLFDRCHEAASRGHEDYSFTFLSSKFAGKEYTFNDVIEHCEECFIDCKIAIFNKYNNCDKLIGSTIFIGWKEEHSLEELEELWNHAKYLGECCDRKDGKDLKRI